MSIFASWVATLAFFGAVFGFGRFLQIRERQNKVNKKVTEAIYQSLSHGAAAGAGTATSWEASTAFGTRYGKPTEYEGRTAKR